MAAKSGTSSMSGQLRAFASTKVDDQPQLHTTMNSRGTVQLPEIIEEKSWSANGNERGTLQTQAEPRVKSPLDEGRQRGRPEIDDSALRVEHAKTLAFEPSDRSAN